MKDELTSSVAFQRFLLGEELEYFAHGVWWILDEYSPVILLKKYDRWRKL